MTGEMFTHDDEPGLKKIIRDEPDEDVEIGNLVWATRARASPAGGRVFAASGVGDPSAGLPGVEGCQRPLVIADDPVATRLRSEDELI